MAMLMDQSVSIIHGGSGPVQLNLRQNAGILLLCMMQSQDCLHRPLLTASEIQ